MCVCHKCNYIVCTLHQGRDQLTLFNCGTAQRQLLAFSLKGKLRSFRSLNASFNAKIVRYDAINIVSVTFPFIRCRHCALEIRSVNAVLLFITISLNGCNCRLMQMFYFHLCQRKLWRKWWKIDWRHQIDDGRENEKKKKKISPNAPQSNLLHNIIIGKSQSTFGRMKNVFCRRAEKLTKKEGSIASSF